MKNQYIKRKSKAVVASILFASALFAVFPSVNNVSVNTFAEDNTGKTETNVRTDDNFSFTEGAYMMYDEANKELQFGRLGYYLELKNPNFEKFFDENYDKATLEFTLYRMNHGDTEATAIQKDIYVVERLNDQTEISHFVKNVAYTQVKEMLDVDLSLLSEVNKIFTVNEKVEDFGGAILKERGIETNTVEEGFSYTDNDNNKIPELIIPVNVESPNSYYYVDFEYKYEDFKEKKAVWDWSKFWFADKITYNSTSGKVSSVPRSIIKMLENMENAGVLETMTTEENYQEAIHMIENTKMEEISIQYLSQIADTPFAEVKKATLTVPVYHTDSGNLVEADDVESALGGKVELDCLGSYVEKIVQVEGTENAYEVIYHKAVCLKAKTADGKTHEYFLDLNNSYQEYYGKLCENEIFSDGLYSYLLNEIKKDYPALNEWAKSNGDFDANNFHGYFGYAVVPETYTWDQLMSEVFDVKTDFQGVLYHFEYEENLSLKAYNKLLGDEGYDYGWLQKAWNNVVGGIKGDTWATHFVYYADPDARQAGISDTGNANPDNNNGAGENHIKDELEKGKTKWEEFIEWLKENGKLILTFTGVTVAVGVGAFVTVRAIQTKPTKGKKKAKAKAKPKKK